MEVIITDTVGFIRHLPDELLQAFKATLEELGEADLLVHVIDVSNPNHINHIQVVEKLLLELDLGDIPTLKVFNKIDMVQEGDDFREAIEREGVMISALDASTFGPFLERAEKMMGKSLSD